MAGVNGEALDEDLGVQQLGGFIEGTNIPADPPAPGTTEAATEPEVSTAPDDDFDVVVEEAPKPIEIDPKAKDYAHVDDKITNKDIQKRIARLTVERKAAEAEVAKWRRMAEASISINDVMASRLKKQSTESHETATAAVKIATDKNKSDLEYAERLFTEAQANGDPAKIAEAQKKWFRAMQDEAVVSQVSVPDAPMEIDELRQFEEFRKVAQQVAQEQPAVPVPEPATNWVRANDNWYIADPTKIATANPIARESTLLANAISGTLVSEGLDIDNPEHFIELNARLRLAAPKIFGQPETKPAQQQPQAPPVRSSVSPVAPVGNRGTAPRRTESLTPEQIAFAKRWDMDPKDLVKYRNGIPD